MQLDEAERAMLRNLSASTKPRGGTTQARPARKDFDGVVDSTKEALRARRFANPVALCRANESALKLSARRRPGRQALSLGADGAVVLSEGVEGDVVDKSLVDGAFWSAMGGFFRLFAIMAAMPGEDVPRQALADFLGVWSRIWDSSVGSRQQKIEAMERFYDERASTLGDGTWMKTLGSDMPFWSESFKGKNLPTCGACSGTGDRAKPRLWEGDDDTDSPPGGSDNDRGRSASPDRERSASPSRERSASPSHQRRSEGEGDASSHEWSPYRQSRARESGSEEDAHASPHRSGAQSRSRSRDRSPSPQSRACSHTRARARRSDREQSRSRWRSRSRSQWRSRSRSRRPSPSRSRRREQPCSRERDTS